MQTAWPKQKRWGNEILVDDKEWEKKGQATRLLKNAPIDAEVRWMIMESNLSSGIQGKFQHKIVNKTGNVKILEKKSWELHEI